MCSNEKHFTTLSHPFGDVWIETGGDPIGYVLENGCEGTELISPLFFWEIL